MMIQNKTIESDTKHRIFMVAAQLFAHKGFNGVSMREISEKSGVTKPTIYYYFKNKEQIYRELINVGIEHSNADVNRIRAMDWPLKKKLVEIFKDKFRDCAQYTDFSRIFLRLYLSVEDLDFLEEVKNAAKTEPMKILEGMIKDSIDSGELKGTFDVKIVTEIVAGVLTYFIWKQVEQGGQLEDEGIAEEIIEYIFSGLASNRK